MAHVSPATLSRRRFIGTAAALGGYTILHPFSVQAAAGQAHLRILSTTDLHCHVYPYDYYGDQPSDTVGLSRTASIVENIRAEATNTITVDNGDYLQGNPMGDYIAYEKGMNEGDIHPIIAGMNALGYDAGTLGNHEFNYGVEFMDKVNAGAEFPIVCSNFAHSLGATPLEDELHLEPFVILDREITDGNGESHPIRVGLIGFVPPQIMLWDRSHLEGKYATRDIIQAAEAWVPVMREQGADIVVALCHSGITPGEITENMENAALQVAGIDGIDAVVSGHHHRVWPSGDFEGEGIDQEAGTLMGKPATMAGFWGSHMGLIDLLLERDGDGWKTVSFESSARPIYQRGEDRKVQALVEDYAPTLEATAEAHAETLEYVRAEVGTTEAPLQSYFAVVSDDPSVQVVSQAQAWYVTELMKGTEWEGLPVLSAAAPFKSGGRGGPDYYTNVPAGPVAIKNVADVYLYPNTLQVVAIKGSDVREWLERSAGIFNTITPGEKDQTLIDPTFPAYNFDTIDGVTYQIDVTQPPRYDGDGALINPDSHRITDLQYNGAPIDEDQTFIVATNNYRAGGGGSFPGADGSTVILRAPDTNRDVIVRYIVDRGTISPASDGNWKLAPAGGATVVYDTGPAALEYLDDVKSRGLDIEPAGDAPDGFARYRISL
ncbi:bifunctional 2',3'-cyclic-nucleotide 2'-phosphodiesterase/3'-nucleotidase [Amaricoccus tamworthensis]|uniref:bifunctional 2',3'-cyclic-nucleotide 2'-phosphodiesterase/3'-nucleotidase n=1 Tax=Amaricoccus tamworthensis TaxID=57002 RepID=UPI003C7A183D